MKLQYLIQHIKYRIIRGTIDLEISGLTANSNEVVVDGAFICIPGFNFDGHNYIGNAVASGATVIIIEKEATNPDILPNNVTVLQVTNTRKALAMMAAAWYKFPANYLTVIAITGTKGKTSTSYMLGEILNKAGYTTGIIGSAGVCYPGCHEPLSNTTPDSLTLHKQLREMVNAGCSHVVMEASSQGFKLFRTTGIHFSYGILLNISEDHIDAREHPNFKDYLSCKLQITEQSETLVVNRGDKIWDYLASAEKQHSITFSAKATADYTLEEYEPVRQREILGASFTIKGRCKGRAFLNIPGLYNAENALAAIAVADDLGIGLDIILESLANSKIPGRSQLLTEYIPKRNIIIDTAHNKMSIEALLKGLRAYNFNNIVCLFGCHGDEAKARRTEMGMGTGEYVDYVIVTADNPGKVPLKEINRDIIAGIIAKKGNYIVLDDREAAIHHAIDITDSKDLIILLGMGNETKQLIGETEYYLCEKEIIRAYFNNSFFIPQELSRKLSLKLRDGITYSRATIKQSFPLAVRKGWERRHNFVFDDIWISYAPGMKTALLAVIHSLTKPGDAILVQTPIYKEYLQLITESERLVKKSNLVYHNGSYEVNYFDLEKKLADPATKLMFLLNPHGPGGLVWNDIALERIGLLCEKYQVLVLSIEHYCDTIRPDISYTPFASVSDACTLNSITCLSPTSILNQAILETAAIVVPDRGLRERIAHRLMRGQSDSPMNLGITATLMLADMNNSWFLQFRQKLYQSKKSAQLYLSDHLPKVMTIIGQADCYLWLDCQSITADTVSLCEYIRQYTSLRPIPGKDFGLDHQTFIALEIYPDYPCTNLESLTKAIKKYQQTLIANKY